MSQQDIAVEWIWRVKEKEEVRVGPKSIKTTIWVAVFVTWGYHNKIPQAGWAQTMDSNFLTVLEVGNWSAGVLANMVLGEGTLSCRGLPSRCILT